MVELKARDEGEEKEETYADIIPEMNASHGMVLQFIVDNNEGIMPDVPQMDYGSAVMNMPLIQHQLMETEQDKQAIGMINNIMIDDIQGAERAAESKNVHAFQTDWLFYKQCESITWAKNMAIKFIERLVDLNIWTLLPVDGWGLKYSKGEYTKEHAHWPHSWAWVYYASACPDCSPLEVYDQPDPAVNKTLKLAREMDESGQAIPESIEYTRHTVIPEAGKLVIMPGWVQHEVKPHQCDHARYGAAGNIAMVRTGGAVGPAMNFDGYVTGEENRNVKH
jgi:hypothetical protein